MSTLMTRQMHGLTLKQSRACSYGTTRTPMRIHAQATPAAAQGELITVTSAQNNGSGSQPITVNYPAQIPGVLPPGETFKLLSNAGIKKASFTPFQLLLSGFLAGCFIAYGGFLACSVQGALPGVPAGLVKLIGGLIFPVGLTLVVTSGTELYTGNTAVMSIAAMEGKISFGGLMYNWFWSYLGNFLGSLAMVAAVVATGMMAGNQVPITLAEAKTALPFATAFIRSVLCNWLVCMAVWNASAATSLSGKMMGLWAPIATFVTIGLEHSVANMFFIPLGIVLGAKVTFTQFLLNNLLPVTLGNTVAGVVFTALAFKVIHGSQPAPAANGNGKN